MKKIGILLFVALFLMSLFTQAYANAESDTQISPKYVVCTNHSFTKFAGYSSSQNEHTYRCSTTGCGAYMVEPCYFSGYCGLYQEAETTSCSKCERGEVSIHDYEMVHNNLDSERRHILTCINVDTYGGTGTCDKTRGDYINCALEPTQIWRGYKANHGHILTTTCSVCAFQYNNGYYAPPNHPNYFSVNNDCTYCKMGEPYHVDFHI